MSYTVYTVLGAMNSDHPEIEDLGSHFRAFTFWGNVVTVYRTYSQRSRHSFEAFDEAAIQEAGLVRREEESGWSNLSEGNATSSMRSIAEPC